MDEVMKRLEKFVKERNWEKYHTPKNLAISIAIESAELMEHFQWNDISFEGIKKDNRKKREVEDEIADVMIYCLLFSIILKRY
ncbi:MAG: nucleotide pyrophosphohydrolase [Thermoplasmata archaeon]|nr:MAG: nucleotide pyrophosphohydrolase [Thermoplasmata archaeon]